MNTKCWQIRRCPASFYTQCAPYTKGNGQACWEMAEGCISCNHDCSECDLYAEAIKRGLVHKAGQRKPLSSKPS